MPDFFKSLFHFEGSDIRATTFLEDTSNIVHKISRIHTENREGPHKGCNVDNLIH